MGVEVSEESIVQLDDSKEYIRLGQGNTAEVYQYEEKKILKLFRDGMPMMAIQREYEITRILQQYLDNIPKAYEFIQYRNRYGIVYEQMIGIDMIQLMTKNVTKMRHYARMLATAHSSIHKKEVDVYYTVKEKLEQDINSCEDLLSEEKEKIIGYLHDLPEKTKVCHFDFHPGNLMICGEKPMVIDWMTACSGDSNADVARTLLLMRMGEVMNASLLQRRVLHIFMRMLEKEYLKQYRRETGVKKEEIDAWMLPVAAARLSEWLTEHERAKLVAFVRKELELLTR